VAELHPAARAERKTIDVPRLIGGERLRMVRARELGLRFTHRHLRGDAGRGDVLIEERRRDAQRRSDVVEAVDFNLGRQQGFGIELDAEQVLHRGAELGPRQPLKRYMAGSRT
jgi:hypothetical protein